MFSKRTKRKLKQRLCTGYVFFFWGGGAGGEGVRLYSMDPISDILHGFVHVLAILHFLFEESTRHEDSCFPGDTWYGGIRQMWGSNGSNFGLKTGIHFDHFCLESGMVFERTTRVYELINRFNSKWVRKKEKYANSKWIWRICLFAL